MRKLEFKNTLYLRSVIEPKDYPTLHKGKDHLPEVAIVGRSNVGKSSLINHLTHSKGLAKTSSVPGKTQTINFYSVDNRLCLVDLPGYGFSKVPGSLKKTWAESLETYLQVREELKLILLLVDLRRDLSEEDKAFIEWANANQKPLYFIFTKADKLGKLEMQEALDSLTNSISEIVQTQKISFITYSVKDLDCRIALNNLLQQFA